MHESNRQILAADIGGTRCRFAQMREDTFGALSLVRVWHAQTAEFSSFDELMCAVRAQWPDTRFDLAALAVPGVVRHARFASCTNISWPINLDRAVRLPEHTLLLNDLAAQGWAHKLPECQDLLEILPGKPAETRYGGPEVRAFLGAGTGVGCCLAVDISKKTIVLPSEAGHVLSPFSGKDAPYAAFLEKLGCRADGEHLLSGRGLSNLFAFYTGEHVSPKEAAARMEGTPVAEHYAGLCGRICQGLVLTTLCMNGLFLCGGVLGANPRLVGHPAFTAAFYDCKRFEELLKSVPVRLVRNADAGLWGAALCAARTFPSQPGD